MKKLNGSAGTGAQIMNNWNAFKYQLNEEKSDGEHYHYDINFGDQTGTFMIVIENGKVSESTTIDCSFERPLGAYNDSTLYDVAVKMLGEQ